MSSIVARSKVFIINLFLFIIGCYLGVSFKINLLVFYIILIIALDFSIIFKKIKILIFFLSFLSLLLGNFYTYNYLQKINNLPVPDGKIYEVSVRVSSNPSFADNNIKFNARITSGKLAGQTIYISHFGYKKLSYGDDLKITTEIKKPENFSDFDYIGYLKSQRITLVAQTNDKNLEIIKSNPSIIKKIYEFNQLLIQNNNLLLPSPLSDISNAMLFGAKLDYDIKSQYSKLGISHILVISGLHTAVIMLVIDRALYKAPKILKFILISLFLLFFIVLSGLGTSIIRGGIMTWLYLLAKNIGRKGYVYTVLFFTAFAMLLFNPLWAYYDLGFQLSFLSVLSIAIFINFFDEKFKFLEPLTKISLSTTLAAQVLTLPLIIKNFKILSIFSVLANLFIIPLVPFMLFFGYLCVFLSFASLPLAKILSSTNYLMLSYMQFINDKLSGFKYAYFNLNQTQVTAILIIFLLFLIYYAKRKANQIFF